MPIQLQCTFLFYSNYLSYAEDKCKIILVVNSIVVLGILELASLFRVRRAKEMLFVFRLCTLFSDQRLSVLIWCQGADCYRKYAQMRTQHSIIYSLNVHLIPTHI